MTDAPLDLAQAFAGIAKELAEKGTVAATLEETVLQAVDVIPGCQFAGVSWLQDGKDIETPASTDDRANRSDAAQFELGEGPSVESAWAGEIELITDLRSEQRWPSFVRRALELGIGSMLCCELPAPRRVIASLNLYAAEARRLDKESVEFVEVFAAHAAIALTARRVETDLRAAVETRGAIGQAIGILMERHKVASGEAFDLLVKASQRSHVKLREVAAFVVETGVDPDDAAKLGAHT